jgi:DNA-binding phage protein
MPLTRSFKQFVKSRIEQDSKFRQALFREAVRTLIDGDVDTAKSVLRDYINATIGFPALAKVTKMSPKSLIRMFGPKGNPSAVNLLGVIVALQAKTGVHLTGAALVAAMQASPHREIDLEPKHARLPVRDMRL